MGTTVSQDNSFRDTLISKTLLEEAIDWIANNLDPEAVFSDEQLGKWAEESGYIEKED